jgi:hypothetical protein
VDKKSVAMVHWWAFNWINRALLLVFGNKRLGVSSSLRHICAICFPGNIQFLNMTGKENCGICFLSLESLPELF